MCELKNQLNETSSCEMYALIVKYNLNIHEQLKTTRGGSGGEGAMPPKRLTMFLHI